MDARFVWLIFALIALVATLSATELVRVFAHRVRAIDQPGGRRVHRVATARLGGLGIFWGFAVALAAGPLAAIVTGAEAPAALDTVGLVIAGGFILVVGLLDDVRSMPAVRKLGMQILAALILFAFGWRVEHLGIPGVGSIATGWFALPLTVGWVVFVSNALNLIDGLDGLAAGVALVATLGAAQLLAPGDTILLAVSAALAGALAAFLWFNIHPALIFMGDAGSLFVGLLLSALTLGASQAASFEAFPLVPALMLAVPFTDTLDAIVRRARRRPHESERGMRGLVRRVFTPDGRHIHHRLRAAGCTVRVATFVLWAAAALGSIAAMLLAHVPTAGAIAAAGCIWAGRRALRTIDARQPTRPLSRAGRSVRIATPGRSAETLIGRADAQGVATPESFERAA